MSGCQNNGDCTIDKACIAGVCRDPCSMRAACGDNALCSVILHQPRCKCPACFVGRAHVKCRKDKRCRDSPKDNWPEPPPKRPKGPQGDEWPEDEEPPPKDDWPETPDKPDDWPETDYGPPKYGGGGHKGCRKDSDCHPSLKCDGRACRDPCAGHSCPSPDERCQATEHRPACVCKYKLSLNARGELTCPSSTRPRDETPPQCYDDSQCPGNLACLDSGRCGNPCREDSCPSGKKCVVLDHQPLCKCDKGCESQAQICLRDKGCPPHLACEHYQCVDPCVGRECHDGSPCIVEDHKAICKFCPPGYAVDKNYGCLLQG